MTNIIETVRDLALKLPCLLGWGHGNGESERERATAYEFITKNMKYSTKEKLN